MTSHIPVNIIPDDEIARLAAQRWPENTKYQARVMTTIALCESGGDANALYLNTDGILAGTLDRGLWGINEVAIRNVAGWIEPSLFWLPMYNVEFAHDIWQFRFDQARTRGQSYTDALIYAYEGWTTYRMRKLQYASVWPMLWKRAGVALGLEHTP